jgi:hypothetical protein
MMAFPKLVGWGSSPAARGRWRAKLAGGGAGGGSFDVKENPFESLIAQDVADADAQDHYPSLRKPCLTTLIVAHPSSGVVREPIHLNRQTGRRTIEVENVRSDRVLPAKAQARQPSIP